MKRFLKPLIYIIVGVFVLGFILLSGDSFFRAKISSYENQQTEVVVIAHRGFSAIAPENTLVAVEKALEIGVDMIEIDVHLSVDSVVVLMHDRDVDRTTNGSGDVRRLPLEEIQDLDAGSWFSPEFRKEPVPTLQEVIELVDGKATLLIEIKEPGDGIEEGIARLIKEYKAYNWCIVQSFKHSAIKNMKEADRRVRRHQLVVGNITLLPIHLAYPSFFGIRGGRTHLYDDVRAINPNYEYLSKSTIDKIHAHGRKVFAWTVDDEDDMESLIDMGVDGLITNHPDRAIRVLRRLGINKKRRPSRNQDEE